MDPLELLAAASLGQAVVLPDRQHAFAELGDSSRRPSTTLAQQEHQHQLAQSEIKQDGDLSQCLDSLGIGDLFDDDGLDLFGSPLNDPNSLPAFEPHVDYQAQQTLQHPSPTRYDAYGPPSSSKSATSPKEDPPRPPPSASPSVTMNPNALFMNPSAMHFSQPAAPPQSREDVQSSPKHPAFAPYVRRAPTSSPVRRASASVSPERFNAVAGPSSASVPHPPIGPALISTNGPSPLKGPFLSAKRRARSPKATSLPDPRTGSTSPPLKRKKQLPDAFSLSAKAKGKQREDKGAGAEDKAAVLAEQIKKVQKINGIKAELARLAEKYDDERRLVFQMDFFKLVTDYDPVEARTDTSTVFKRWAENHDLAKLIPEGLLDNSKPTLGDSSRWRTSSSRKEMAQQDALKRLLEPLPFPSDSAKRPPSPSRSNKLLSSSRPKPQPRKRTAPGENDYVKDNSHSSRLASPSVNGRPVQPRATVRTSPLDRPLPQPRTGMSRPGAKPYHRTATPPPEGESKKPRPATRAGSTRKGDLPIAVKWGGNQVWNPEVERVAFVTLDDADLIESDEELKKEKEMERDAVRLKRLKEEGEERRADEKRKRKKRLRAEQYQAELALRMKEASNREAGPSKVAPSPNQGPPPKKTTHHPPPSFNKAPPPKKAVSKLSQAAAKTTTTLAKRDEERKVGKKAQADDYPSFGHSRLPPPQRFSRMPPPQITFQRRPHAIVDKIPFSDTDSDDAPDPRRPRPRPRFTSAAHRINSDSSDEDKHARRPNKPSSKPRDHLPPFGKKLFVPQIIEIDASSDDSLGGGMEAGMNLDSISPAGVSKQTPTSLTSSQGKAKAIKLSLKGKSIGSYTASGDSSPTSTSAWNREPPPPSPPLSPIITAANLPPQPLGLYPLYTDEAQLPDEFLADLPPLHDYVSGLSFYTPVSHPPEVICLDDNDEVIQSQTQAVWEASVKERVAIAQAHGRLDAGGKELEAANEERLEDLEDNQVLGFPRSNGFLTEQDRLLADIHDRQESIGRLRQIAERTMLRIAEMIEEYWARKEGRDAKTLRELEKLRKNLARKVAKDIRAKWQLAVKVVLGKHRAKEDAEEQRRNKEQLSELLERSQALLAERRADLVGPSPDPVWEDDSDGRQPSVSSEDEVDRDVANFFKSPSPPPAQVVPSPKAVKVEAGTVLQSVAKRAASIEIIAIDSDDGDDSDDEVQIISSPVDPRTNPSSHSSTPIDPSLSLVEVPPPAPSVKRELRPAGLDVPTVQSLIQLASPTESSQFNFDDVPLESESEAKSPEDAGRVPRIPTPSLLRGELRPYQQDGLDWLVSLYEGNTNGILADEMGLGKTIQTIALLAHLACDKGMWGPHLVIVPTSVLLNWDMEFKKFLPGFNVVTYYGNKKERDSLRRGWDQDGAFEVCITSYQIAVTDQRVFKRKQWGYMVLDEAHNIKNFKSQKWTTLLGFNAERRLLLTGTPLQNNLQELWSLLYFLMPSEQELDGTAFANHKVFNEWFSAPMEKAIEAGNVTDAGTKGVVSKLHTILRPYVLRRLKADVEKQLPAKKEHVVYCRLSKRQRFLYDEFMSRAETREKLSSGNFLSISNCLMQLRKVCNHPDLFETRPIRSSFVLLDRSSAAEFEIKVLYVRRQMMLDIDSDVLRTPTPAFTRNVWPTNSHALSRFRTHPTASMGVVNDVVATPVGLPEAARLDASFEISRMVSRPLVPASADYRTIAGWKAYREGQMQTAAAMTCQVLASINSRKSLVDGHLQEGTIRLLQHFGFGDRLVPRSNLEAQDPQLWPSATKMDGLVLSFADRAAQYASHIQRYSVIPPAVVAPDLVRLALPEALEDHAALADPSFDTLHHPAVAHQITFPDATLIQYDCGKLQVLYEMFRELKAGGHRVLIFTQMARVLDILEGFLTLHGYRYLRLDGSTTIEERQMIMEKFNADDKIFCLIATTQSGGVGLNLTGADTVIQFDSDWNPAMDKQAQDRAHRIGQTREVNIYRLVSRNTVEENMLKKANQKRQLDDLVMHDGEFTTDYFSKLDWRDALNEVVEEVLAEPTTVALPRSTSAMETDRQVAEMDDEEMRDMIEATKDESEPNEDDFDAEEGQGSGGSQRQQVDDGAGEEEEDEADDGLEGLDKLMVQWVEDDWEYFG